MGKAGGRHVRLTPKQLCLSIITETSQSHLVEVVDWQTWSERIPRIAGADCSQGFPSELPQGLLSI